MLLKVKTVRGVLHTIDVDVATKILEVKQLINKQLGDEFPAQGQVIIHLGKILQDDTTLADNNINEENFIVVTIKKSLLKAKETPPPQTERQAAAAPTPVPPKTETPAVQVPATEPEANPASNLQTGSQLEQTIQQLCDMGFSLEQVKQALQAAFNNPERAVEYLTNGIPEDILAAHTAPPAEQPPAATEVPTAQGQAAPQEAEVQEGPNTQPLDMFGQSAQSAARGGGGGGGPGQGVGGMTAQQLVQMQNLQDPHAVLEYLRQQDPEMLQQLLRGHAMRAQGGEGGEQEAGMEEGAINPAGLPDFAQGAPATITLTPEEGEAIERLQAMGFERDACLEAYLACEKDETLAANYLLNMTE